MGAVRGHFFSKHHLQLCVTAKGVTANGGDGDNREELEAFTRLRDVDLILVLWKRLPATVVRSGW